MITTFNGHRVEYLELFDELTKLMLGYVPCNTYNIKEPDSYYYKEDEGLEEKNYVFHNLSINSLDDFNTALTTYKVLYIRAKDDKGNLWDPADIGFIEQVEESRKEEYLRNFQGITTIEEYLNWLATLKDLNSEYVLKYSRVPRDEEVFKIDTNTRVITTPDNFRKNGLAVQGDDVAEVVYFSADRFYDVVDLGGCEIYIKWETPKKKKGTYEVKYRDITSDSGKVIFEWPITKEVAGEAGNLKYSVQFLQKNEEGKTTYSLNTLSNTVAVKAGIGFEVGQEGVEPDDVGTRLYDRIRFTEIVGGASADVPVFVIEPDDSQVYDLTADEHPSQELSAFATSNDTGAISYVWKRIDLKDDNTVGDTSGDIVNTVEKKYVEVSHEDMVQGCVYYYYDNNNVENMPIRYIMPAVFDSTYDDIQFYQLQSVCTVELKEDVTVPGAYYATAYNKITNSIASRSSDKKAIFPRPVQPELESLTFDDESKGFFENEKDVELTINSVEEANNVLSYKWMYKTSKDGDFNEIEGANKQSYTAKKETPGLGTGYYTVEVTHTRNGESKSICGADMPIGEDGNNPFVIRITSAPVAAEWKVTDGTPISISSKDLESSSDGFSIDITNINDIEADIIAVSWYVYETVESEPVNECIAGPLNIGLEQNKVTFNPRKYEAKIKEVTKQDNIEAYYYPVFATTINNRTEYSNTAIGTDKMLVVTPPPLSPEEVVTNNLEESDIAVMDLDDGEEVSVMSLDEEEIPESNRVTLNTDSKLFFED